MTVKYFNSHKKILAIDAKARGATNKEAAEIAGVTPGTMSEWMKDPAFEEEIYTAQRKLLYTAQDKFRSNAVAAVETIADIMENSENEKLRLESAKYILDTINIAPMKDCGLWWTKGPESEANSEYESEAYDLSAVNDPEFMDRLAEVEKRFDEAMKKK